MGHSQALISSICSCYCCRKTVDDTREQNSIKVTPTNYTHKEMDLDVLAAKISGIFDKAKDEESSGSKKASKRRWKPSNSEDVFQLDEYLSDFSKCSDVLERLKRGDYGNEFMGSVTNLLKEVGEVQWVTFGLLLVGMTLQRFEMVSDNQEERMDVLDEMFRLCLYLKSIKEMESLRDKMGDLLEKSIQLVVEGTILCTAQDESSSFKRFWRANDHKKQSEIIRRDIDKVHTHLMLRKSLYTVQTLNRGGIRLPRHRFYPAHAVGIEEAVEQVTNLLELDSEKKVLVVLLHGFGGTGKTTIADAVFASINDSSFSFSKVSLFENVGSVPNVTQVQKDILDDISSPGEYEKPKSHTEGQSYLSEVLKEKPCFLYIDNVLDREELRKLLPKNMDNCKKLRILMTARDSTVVEGLRIGNHSIHVYAVPSLEKEASMAILCASMNVRAWSDCVDQNQLEYILKMCGGVPLVLEIVGCYIGNELDKNAAFRIIKEEYENSGGERLALEKVEFFAFAFDTIEEAYKDAFLDICAYFVGRRWHVVGCILGEEVVELLEKRALIKRHYIDWRQRGSSPKLEAVDVQIHDFILEIGRKRCKGNRITNLHGLRALLSTNEEALQGIKGIFLQEPLQVLLQEVNGETIKMSAKKLDILSPWLRIFSTGCMDEVFAAIEITGTCQASFRELVYWDSPKAEPPFVLNSSPQLRDLEYSPVKAVTLSELPTSLRHLSINLGNIEDKQRRIQVFQGEGTILPNMRSMTIAVHEDPDTIFVIPPQLFLPMKTIRELFFTGLVMENLPDDFHHLEHLTILWLKQLRNLKRFPDSFARCRSLMTLVIIDCPQLESLPQKLHELPSLEFLTVSKCKMLRKLPRNIGACTPLKMLTVESCPGLHELPESFPELASLEVLKIENCENIKCLPANFGKLSALQSLNLTGCKNLVELCQNFHQLSSLKEIILNGCTALENGCLDELVKSRSLEVVHIKNSPQLIQRWEEMKDNHTKIKFIY